MTKKQVFLIISCAMVLSGCNGLGVLLNPPTVTGRSPSTNAQTFPGSEKNVTRTVLREAPDLSQHVSPYRTAHAMGKAVRTGNSPGDFNQHELDIIAQHYIHCSANWNAIAVDGDGSIRGGASPLQVIGFINRPDEQWRRTVYNMDGKVSEV